MAEFIEFTEPAYPAWGVRPRPVFKDLGKTRMAKRYRFGDSHVYGKWCGECEGIYFALSLEVGCPVCGSRR
jgi:hypothetical protein